MPVHLDDLYRAYGAMLRAKAMEGQFQSFGGGVAESIRRDVVKYEEMEAQYVKELRVKLKDQSDAFIASLGPMTKKTR